jgi:hypothetical protein
LAGQPTTDQSRSPSLAGDSPADGTEAEAGLPPLKRL